MSYPALGRHMGMDSKAMPPVVTAQEWQKARDELLVAEKAATRALDALAARARVIEISHRDQGSRVLAA